MSQFTPFKVHHRIRVIYPEMYQVLYLRVQVQVRVPKPQVQVQVQVLTQPSSTSTSTSTQASSTSTSTSTVFTASTYQVRNCQCEKRLIFLVIEPMYYSYAKNTTSSINMVVLNLLF